MSIIEKLYEFDIKRRVPDSLNEQEPPSTLVFRKYLYNLEKLYEFDIKRRVPDGPNEQEPSVTSTFEKTRQI